MLIAVLNTAMSITLLRFRWSPWSIGLCLSRCSMNAYADPPAQPALMPIILLNLAIIPLDMLISNIQCLLSSCSAYVGVGYVSFSRTYSYWMCLRLRTYLSVSNCLSFIWSLIAQLAFQYIQYVYASSINWSLLWPCVVFETIVSPQAITLYACDKK